MSARKFNEAVSLLGNAGAASCTTFLYANTGARSGPSLRKIATDGPLAQELVNAVGQWLVKRKSDADNDPIGYSDYVFEDMPSHHIRHIDVAGDQLIEDWFAQFGALATLPAFDGNHAFLKKVRFYGIKVSVPGQANEVYCFRAKGPATILKKKGGVFAVLENGRYVQTAPEHLEFDSKADVIVYDGTMFVLSSSACESIVGFGERIKAAARNMLENTFRAVPLANQDEVVRMVCEDMRLAKKAVSIARQGTVANMDVNGIRNTIAQFSLPIELTNTNQGFELRVDHDNPRHMWDLLRLLASDHVEAVATHDRWVTTAKQRL